MAKSIMVRIFPSAYSPHNAGHRRKEPALARVKAQEGKKGKDATETQKGSTAVAGKGNQAKTKYTTETQREIWL